MNGRQVALLLAALVVLGGAGLFLQGRNAAQWKSDPSGSQGKIVDFPVNDVAHIRIKDAKSEVNIVSGKDGWVVKERSDYPANFEQVSGLIRKVWELKPVQDVKVGPSQFGRLQLIEPGQGGEAGTLLEFKANDDRRLAGLIVGKKFMRGSGDAAGEGGGFAAGRYVMAAGASKRVALVSDPLSEVEVKPEQWLNRDFIKIEKPKTITLASPTVPALNWKLSRENDTAPWKLSDAKPGEELDSAKTSGLATAFSSPSFTDLLAADAKPADTGMSQPNTVTIETTDGFVYTLSVGHLTGESYPLSLTVTATLTKERVPAANEKPEDKKKLDQEFAAKQKELSDKLAREQKFQGRTYLVAKYAVDQLVKDRSQLLAEKKPEPTPSPSLPAVVTPAVPAPAAVISSSPTSTPKP